MLTDTQKQAIIEAQVRGENPDDFLMGNPLSDTDIPEYQAFWHDLGRVDHIRPVPTSPNQETPWGI